MTASLVGWKFTKSKARLAAACSVLAVLAGMLTLVCVQASATALDRASANVLCNYAYSAFNATPSVNATSVVRWSCAGAQRLLSANGLPDHAVGTFPNRNNPPTIAAQNVTAVMPLVPELTSAVTRRSGPRANVGYALNGIKIDPSTAGTCDDAGASCTMARGSGAWNIEAMGQSTFNFGTDSNNAHVQPGGAYHYHGIPEGFVARLGKGTAMTLIGWAVDGFPIYARYGYSVASDTHSSIRVIRASYQLKSVPAPGRPAISAYPMGTFTQDYEYVAGTGDLDECNGRMGVTPEFPEGTYHYFATDTYPYLQRCIKGRL